MVTIKDGFQRGYENALLKFEKRLYASGVVDISQIVRPTHEQLRYHLSKGFFDANRNIVRQIKGIRANKSQKVLIEKLGLINEAIYELNKPIEAFNPYLLGTPKQDFYIDEIARMVTNLEVGIKEMAKFYGINYLNAAKKVVDNCDFVKTDAGLYLLNPV